MYKLLRAPDDRHASKTIIWFFVLSFSNAFPSHWTLLPEFSSLKMCVWPVRQQHDGWHIYINWYGYSPEILGENRQRGGGGGNNEMGSQSVKGNCFTSSQWLTLPAKGPSEAVSSSLPWREKKIINDASFIQQMLFFLAPGFHFLPF